MVLANLGPSQDLAQRLAKLERLVAGLASENALDNASANQRDGTPGLTIAQDSYGAVVLTVNHAASASTPIGANGQHPPFLIVGEDWANSGAQAGSSSLRIERPDGSSMLWAGRLSPAANYSVDITDGYPTSFNALGRNIVLSSSATWGLAQPWIPITCGPVAPAVGGAGWFSTTNAAWTTLASFYFIVTSPALAYRIAFATGSGITGNARVQVAPVGGSYSTIDSWALPANTSSFRDKGGIPGAPAYAFSGLGYGATGADFGSFWQLNIDAQVTGGASSVSLAPYFIAQRQA
jgi:hypothetical protein